MLETIIIIAVAYIAFGLVASSNSPLLNWYFAGKESSTFLGELAFILTWPYWLLYKWYVFMKNMPKVVKNTVTIHPSGKVDINGGNISISTPKPSVTKRTNTTKRKKTSAEKVLKAVVSKKKSVKNTTKKSKKTK